MIEHDKIRELAISRVLSVQDNERLHEVLGIDLIPTTRYVRMTAWLESKPVLEVSKPGNLEDIALLKQNFAEEQKPVKPYPHGNSYLPPYEWKSHKQNWESTYGQKHPYVHWGSEQYSEAVHWESEQYSEAVHKQMIMLASPSILSELESKKIVGI